MSSPHVEVFINNDNRFETPSDDQFTRWVQRAISDHRDSAELSIRIVDNTESQTLNHTYRGKDKPTNVLSFPAHFPDGVDVNWLGDLILAQPVVLAEAKEQGKTLEAHWAHLTVHGVLHLLGYDHIDDSDAEEMEKLETEILVKMGYPPPYKGN